MFESVLVANRGEIACRIIRTLRTLGVRSVAVHSDADSLARHVLEADESVALGGTSAADSYLSIEKMMNAIAESGAEAVHPGYGFLSENARFADAVAAAGSVFVGPDPDCIRQMGDKINARNFMAAAGVPVAAGTSQPVSDPQDAVAEARRIGYPLMVKPAAGGGGIGMGIVRDERELQAAIAAAATRGRQAFGSAEVLLERYLENARHVEMQIFGLADGTVLALGERDCSVQRRHQKVVEEAPAPGVDDVLRAAIQQASVRAGSAINYRGAGTVEWLLDPATDDFVFLEMNTRLQVEHAVTELVTGLDLVAEQLRVAAGAPPSFDPAHPPATRGHAIEFRVYAEDPVRFLPGPGTIRVWQEPTGDGVRVDSGYRVTDAVTPWYDPLLAKLCVWGTDRAGALRSAHRALEEFRIEGPKHNLPFLREVLKHPDFVSGDYDTGLVARMRPWKRDR